jgi:hypothetical protein
MFPNAQTEIEHNSDSKIETYMTQASEQKERRLLAEVRRIRLAAKKRRLLARRRMALSVGQRGIRRLAQMGFEENPI